MSSYPSVDESRDRLHRAGWSVGEIATATRWLVTGTNGGENVIKAAAGRFCVPGTVGGGRCR
jgi:hypothetical protein